MQVWRFPIALSDEFSLKMPAGARILSVRDDHAHGVSLWALVDESQPKVERHFRIVGTGHDASAVADCPFIDTFTPGSGLWFHLFEVPEV